MNASPNLIHDIHEIISQARTRVAQSVNFERVLMYWEIGKRIFEEEQGGEERAEYGIFLIKSIAQVLEPEYGSGFSARQLERFRQFYRINPIASSLRTQFSWTHYKLMLTMDNEDKRGFYLAEVTNNFWTARELERQINRQFYERRPLIIDNEYVLAAFKMENPPDDQSSLSLEKIEKTTKSE